MRFSTFLRPTLAALALSALCISPAAAWVDPTTGSPQPTRVSRPAEIPEQNWKPGHRGVDLPLSVGDPVLAAGDGVVAFVGSVAGTPVVSVDHAAGIRTTYQPVRSDLKPGDQVREGQEIGSLAHAPAGLSGSLSESFSESFSGAHDGLHWGALIGKDTYLDPLTLLDPPRIRLKPLAGDTTPAGGLGRTRA